MTRYLWVWGLVLAGCAGDRPELGERTDESLPGADSGAVVMSDSDTVTNPASSNFGNAGERPDSTTGSMTPSSGGTTDGDTSGGGDTSGDASTPASEMTGDSSTLEAAAPNGASCQERSDCASEFCVDGVCCDSACDQACGACDRAGREGVCSAVEDEEQCPPLQCPETTDCRQYESANSGSCADLGECRKTAQCVAVDAASGAACADGAGTCDGEGSCVVPDKLNLGQTCSSNEECAEGHCVALGDGSNVCCDSACEGTCEACGSDGRCNQMPPDDSHCSAVTCGEQPNSCASYPASLNVNRCAAFGQCHTAETYCTVSNAASGTSCGSGLECDGAGQCISRCETPELWCGDGCINPATDNTYCGANESCESGVQCSSGTLCEGGECQVQCEQGMVRCGGTCVDPQTNADYCGASNSCAGEEAGSKCAAGEPCLGGACRNWERTVSIAESTDGIAQATLAVTETGNALVAWVELSPTGQYLLRARSYDAISKTWAAATTLETTGSPISDVKAFGEGPSSAVVLWSQYEAGEIKSRRWTGSEWDSTFTLEYVSVVELTVAYDGRSRAAIAWWNYDDDLDQYVAGIRSWNPTTHTWNSRATIVTSERQLTSGAVAIDDNGDMFAMWHRLPDPTPGDWEVWGSRYTSSSGTWAEPEQIGAAMERQSGYQLVITGAGNLLAYWAGRMKGLVWHVETGGWATITREGEWLGASICGVGGEDAMLVGKPNNVDDYWAQLWNGNDAQLEARVELHPGDFYSAVLACSTGVALAAGADWARRWNTATGWGAVKSFEAGSTLDAVISSGGASFVARGVGSGEGVQFPYSGLQVEHFE